MEGSNSFPTLETSIAGVVGEDAGVYSCVVLDEGLQIVTFSSIAISVLRKLCMEGHAVHI